jgi:hypothetical protein
MKMRGDWVWGAGVRSHPCAYHVRFTKEEDRRLKKMLKRRRLTTMQAFLHAAVMRALNDAELGQDVAAEARKEEPKEKPLRGLGIRDRLESDREEISFDRDERKPERIADNPIAGRSASTIDDEIMSLARTIVNAAPSARTEVQRAACKALAMRAQSEYEALQLLESLNEAIKRLDGKPQTNLERVRARMSR